MSHLTHDLEAVVADANAHLTAIAGGATDAHLNAIGVISATAEQARLSAETLEGGLAALDAAATAAADAYFDAIAWVRDAITSGGEMSPSQFGDLGTQLEDALGEGTDLDALLAEVVSYDSLGSDAVAAAQTAVDEASAALKTAEEDFAIRQAELEAASQAVTSWAVQAIDKGNLVYDLTAAVETAIAAGRLYEAVVHMQDLTYARNDLNGEISFDGHQFDANNSDADAVTTAMDSAWDTVHGNYEAALTALVDKQDDLYAAQLALAVAVADADERRARRLVDAAALVQVLHDAQIED
ncbi:MAG: hypothetical protein KME65_03510 [Candidatus Thiodiazotropha sp. (ex Ctena orbiculata)]|uniref:Uncharacterized protein n=1 Tax=Candidatus Thiodiazotropha taylori TaxID=2792791 RepID=A0A944QTQ8_9GAMM|nr:hypothetical protein [Candidatus Thiodiazotropha taylori]MBV2138784.1 hypothetical protein [Candidatus Thiodiazotropha taylori]